MNQNQTNSELYQKKSSVIAFQVDAPCSIQKHWGRSEGKRGDYMVRPNDSDDKGGHDYYMYTHTHTHTHLFFLFRAVAFHMAPSSPHFK